MKRKGKRAAPLPFKVILDEPIVTGSVDPRPSQDLELLRRIILGPRIVHTVHTVHTDPGLSIWRRNDEPCPPVAEEL